jgi:8-oxo-dGTP pyrophosphatase MutT (NUDIX family)
MITCGIIITDGKYFLIGRLQSREFWDIPKGIRQKGETFAQAALRELFEETSISLREDDLLELGTFTYTKEKKIHLFLYYTDDLPHISKMECGLKEQIEMDEYKYIPINQHHRYLPYNLRRIIDNVKEIVYTFNKKMD